MQIARTVAIALAAAAFAGAALAQTAASYPS